MDNELWTAVDQYTTDRLLPRDPALETTVEKAVRELRYGTVAVNVWPAVSYAVMTPPWGGHPSASLIHYFSGRSRYEQNTEGSRQY